MRKTFAGIAAGAALFLVIPLFAHHSGALYDRNAKPVTLDGTVTKFLMMNPHSQIHFEVVDKDGKTVKWVAESAAPARLIQLGWTRNSLKPGDKINVTGAPFLDGRPVMSIVKLTGGGIPTLTEGAF